MPMYENIKEKKYTIPSFELQSTIKRKENDLFLKVIKVFVTFSLKEKWVHLMSHAGLKQHFFANIDKNILKKLKKSLLTKIILFRQKEDFLNFLNESNAFLIKELETHNTITDQALHKTNTDDLNNFLTSFKKELSAFTKHLTFLTNDFYTKNLSSNIEIEEFFNNWEKVCIKKLNYNLKKFSRKNYIVHEKFSLVKEGLMLSTLCKNLWQSEKLKSFLQKEYFKNYHSSFIYEDDFISLAKSNNSKIFFETLFGNYYKHLTDFKKIVRNTRQLLAIVILDFAVNYYDSFKKEIPKFINFFLIEQHRN